MENNPSSNAEVTVKRIKNGATTFFEVRASGFARATPERSWRVLTDYERLSEFVPNLRASKLLSRTGNQAVIEQQGKGSVLFLTQNIHLVMRVKEQPNSSIEVALVSGDMKHYVAHWELVPSTQNGIEGTRINYSGKMEPDFFVPPVFGKMIVRNDVKEMVEAFIKEIEKEPIGK